MRKSLCLIVLLSLFTGRIYADRIDAEEAYAIANNFFDSETGRQKAPAGDAPLRLAETSEGYYAFTRGSDNGYVIVAADDRVFRLSLALQVAQTLGKAMGLLGIEMPERM